MSKYSGVFKNVVAGFLMLVGGFLAAAAALAWTGPTAAPPGNNVVFSDKIVRLSAIRTFSTPVTNATYTTPADTSYIVVEVWGGGGGGTNGDANAGAGGTTCFGTNATACTTPLLQATGGGGGLDSGAGGAGGTGSLGDVNLVGSGGGTEKDAGGGAPRGGGGGSKNVAGSAYGGGGGGGGNGSDAGTGAGGGGGGYSSKFIAPTVAATYKYTVGAAGTGSFAGGAGGILVYEYGTFISSE